MGTFRKNLQESLKWLKSVRQFDKLMTAENYVKSFISICEDPETFGNMKITQYVEILE